MVSELVTLRYWVCYNSDLSDLSIICRQVKLNSLPPAEQSDGAVSPSEMVIDDQPRKDKKHKKHKKHKSRKPKPELGLLLEPQRESD